jgi:DNA-binding GntR family transcriptional regulator
MEGTPGPAEAGPLAERAYGRLIAMLREGELASGEFVSMPALVDRAGFPIAATREAVKRAEEQGLVEVLPKRGVVVMRAGPTETRDCLDLRALLDQEGARRLVAGDGLPAEARAALRRAHEAILAEARAGVSGDLPERAKDVDLTLHDALATGLDNPLAREVYRVNRNRVAVVQNTRPFLADRVVSAMEEHLAILDALERRDAEAAVAAIAHHYRTTLRWWGVGG